MRKILLVNGIITFVGLLLDLLGVLNLTFTLAGIGLACGIIDGISFFWMWDEIKDWMKKVKARRRKTAINKDEAYWNNKYPKTIIKYSGRFIPKFGKYELDVRAFFVNPRCDELQRIVKKWKHFRNDDRKARLCLLWVMDNFKYVSDKRAYGLEEFWTYPSEALKTRIGDCDDGAILLANLLVASGIPYWKVRITAGMVPEGGHAYVTYFCEKKNHWVVLDWCYYPNRKPIHKRKYYKDSKIYRSVWFSWNVKYAFAKGTKAKENGMPVIFE